MAGSRDPPRSPAVAPLHPVFSSLAMAFYPPETDQSQLAHLVTAFTDWSLAHGLAVRPAADTPAKTLATPAPVSLFPSFFPRAQFQTARDVQRIYNALYARVASDHEFLEKLSKDLAEVDSFISHLYTRYTESKSAQHLSLGLFRSDYMRHASTSILQVEFNTIASSFGGLASRVSDLHRFLIRARAYPMHPLLSVDNLHNIPSNPAAEGLAEGIAHADKMYGAPAPEPGREKVVLFIVQKEERNAFDQRWLEYELVENHAVRVYRVSLPEVLDLCKVEDTPERRLLLQPPHLVAPLEVSVVYFRAGYGPDDYPTEKEWDARALLERSYAIKCPTIATQLAGSKKVQQVLSEPDVLEKYITEAKDMVKIRKTFTGIWPLDRSERGMEARKLAMEEPERFVLKPQREGGGNNVYRGKIPAFLNEVGEEKWEGYILMEMIEVPEAEGVVVREGSVNRGKVVGELGVYGWALWDEKGEVKENKECGWLLRTKGSDSEEGGVAAGFGCVDGVLLVD